MNQALFASIKLIQELADLYSLDELAEKGRQNAPHRHTGRAALERLFRYKKAEVCLLECELARLSGQGEITAGRNPPAVWPHSPNLPAHFDTGFAPRCLEGRAPCRSAAGRVGHPILADISPVPPAPMPKPCAESCIGREGCSVHRHLFEAEQGSRRKSYKKLLKKLKKHQQAEALQALLVQWLRLDKEIRRRQSNAEAQGGKRHD